MDENKRRNSNNYDIAGLIGEAFTKVARLEITMSGFKCTGIYLFDRNIFSYVDYLDCDITNIPLEKISDQQDLTSTMETPQAPNVPEKIDEEILDVQPSTSFIANIHKNILKLSPLLKESELKQGQEDLKKVKFSLHLPINY